MKLLLKIEKIIYNIEVTAIVILLLSLSLFAFVQVIMRNLFSTSIIWMVGFNGFALLALAMLGASIAAASFERSHINIDLFQGYLPFPYNKYLNAALTFIAGAACALFIFIAAHYVMVSKSIGKIEATIHAPEWVITLIFPIGFCSMAYKFFVCFLKDIHDIRDKNNTRRGDNDDNGNSKD